MTLNESGSAPGVGPIHISEIKPTLEPISKFLGIDLMNQALGSVGKKEFSGDIDVAIDIAPQDFNEFQKKLEASPLFSYVEKTSVFITKIKIQNYDPNKQSTDPKHGPRTGYVQLDFMPGNPGWLKTYYHSPSDKESKYKGVFRNILLSTIAAFYNRKDSEEKIEDGRPLESERYLWSGTQGLVRIKRTPVPKKSGQGYTKKNNNEVIGEPIFDAAEIAKELGLGDPKALNSYESLKQAMETNYPEALTQKILDSFAQNNIVKDVGVPDDLRSQSVNTESLADKHLRRIKELLPK